MPPPAVGSSEPALLVEATRRTTIPEGGEVVESRHHGHIAVVGPDARVVASLGDPERPTFARSAVKPFQATAALEVAGDPELPDEEVAVAWSSHRGEPFHLAAVAALCQRADITPEQLTTPPATPLRDPGATPSRIAHNCSGKHALFAFAGRAIGCPHDRLLDVHAPLQGRVLDVLAEAMGPASAVAVDGCGAPAVQVGLDRLAAAFRALATDQRYARVRAAGLAHPAMVGGTGEPESALLREGVLAKPGAESVFAAGWVDDDGSAWGLALKVEDGSPRAAGVALLSVLSGAGVVSDDAWLPPPVLGGGRPAGRLRPSEALARFAVELRAG